MYKHFLSATSQILTDLSLDEEAKCLPLPENDTLKTHDACPERVPATSECALEFKKKKFKNCGRVAQHQRLLTHHTISYGHHLTLLVAFANPVKNTNFSPTLRVLPVFELPYQQLHRKCL